MSSPLSSATASRLLGTLNGRVIRPDDASYDTARQVFYGGLDLRPALIVRVADATDVTRVIALAQDSGAELAIRGGGHSLAGHSTTEGGIVLDLGDLNRLAIDPKERTAWAGAGLTAGAYTVQAGAHGLATGFGDTGSVGIAGITLGGGVGYLSRRYGLTIDDLLAADVVTADGQQVRADAEQHPELFWALRGGGGNFGVVTRLHYRLHPVDRVVGGMLLLPATADVITSVLAEAMAAPEELSTIVNVMTAPPLPFIPPELHGTVLVAVLLAYAGAVDAGERQVDRLRAVAKPIADLVRPMAYPEIFPSEEGEEFHPSVAARTLFLDSVERSTAQAILDHLATAAAPLRAVQLRVLGGAVTRVPADATAFAHRDRPIMANVAAMSPAAGAVADYWPWVDGLVAALPRSGDGAYVNFLGDEGPDRVRAAYPAATWDRLVAVKRRYDPGNLFRRNQNIDTSH